jgi:transposase
MLIKTLLHKLEKIEHFIFAKVSMGTVKDEEVVIVDIVPRKNSNPECPECNKHCKIHDYMPTRLFEYVPWLGHKWFFRYTPRRASCPDHGVHVEYMPWAIGKDRITTSYLAYLGNWAKRLSWKETAEVFGTSWDTVYKAVEYAVEYGLANRVLSGVTQIGIDEIKVFIGHKYLTLVYQLDAGRRRLLWSGYERKAKTLLQFFKEFGTDFAARLEYVCTDMWPAYMSVVKKKATNAKNVLDRFHIMKKFNEAIDEIRRGEVKAFKAEKQDNLLLKARWLLLKRPENLDEKQTIRLKDLLKLNLSSTKGYLMREDFQQFWQFEDPKAAGKFLDEWVTRTLRSNIDPLKKVAKMLRRHKPLIMNWFEAKGELSSGAVEGLNLKAKLTMRKAFGFRTVKCLQIALYHALGALPERPSRHRFC